MGNRRGSSDARDSAVLAWALPDAVAGRLRAETGQGFAGQPGAAIDLCVRVSRSRQRRAALLHASQVSPSCAAPKPSA